jgi:uncharacterized alkaline shock family protein YloU
MTELAGGTPQFEQVPEQVPEQVNVLVTDPPPDPRPAQLAAQVKGRIDIEDEVVEKVAGLAAAEVEGVADLGGDVARAVESVRERVGIGHRRGDQGVKAHINGREVSIEVTIVIEYGHVVMDVARQVKTNVAIQTNRMLGLRVVEVNVVVDDVRMPAAPRPAEAAEDDQRLTIGE